MKGNLKSQSDGFPHHRGRGTNASSGKTTEANEAVASMWLQALIKL